MLSTGQHTVVTQMPAFSLSLSYFEVLFYYYLNYYMNITGKFGARICMPGNIGSRAANNERKGDLLSTVSGDVVEVENSVVTSLQTVSVILCR